MMATTSDRAWVQAMLDVEAALARAESRIGLIPATAADGIAGLTSSTSPSSAGPRSALRVRLFR
jgi:adenylosuccinate lyase